MKAARYWHMLDDGRIQCDLCPRHCRLSDNQRGTCFVRERRGNQLIQTAYGLSTGFAVDPIEKKPLNHFLPGSEVLSFGTAGCNLQCQFCQNWQMSRCRQMERMSVAALPEEIAALAKQEGCESVAFTYNDPVIFLEYAVDTAKACHEAGVRTVAVTAGWICEEPRREFFEHMDAANIDLKAFTNRFYSELCGATLQPVLDTLVYLGNETNVWFEVTTLLIPGQNDSEEEIDAMSKWAVEYLGPNVPWHFTAYHPVPAWDEAPRTPLATLRKARGIAKANGLNHVYIGNANDPEGAATWCPSCGHKLIRREGYRTENELDEGRCPKCGVPCPGVWS